MERKQEMQVIIAKISLIVTQWFLENHEDRIFRDIIIALCEIQEIIYLPDNQRSPQTVLRLYIITFIHMIYVKMNLRENLKKLARRKFFGSYYHSLIRQCPELFQVEHLILNPRKQLLRV